MKKIIALLLVAFSFSGCEKDDICDPLTSTTPGVVIEFYDAASPNTLKPVTNLRLKAPEFTTFIDVTNGVSKIAVPIKTTADTTTLEFIQNGVTADTTDDNTDVLTFAYTRETLYVSRACGYKIVFDLTSTDTNILAADADNWIDHIVITQPNIETENDTHIKIYF